MVGKIVRLLGVPMSEEFEVQYGIPETPKGVFDARFATIKLANLSNSAESGLEPPFTYIYGGYIVQDLKDAYKEIIICNKQKEDIPVSAVEDTLLVIIDFGWFETSAKKIAGRFEYEGILEMHAGDVIYISKGLNYIKKTFMAVQVGNELILIKKER